MKSPYWDRFFHRVTNGTRTGLGVLIDGILLQFVKGLKEYIMFSTFTPVMTICVCDSTIGKAIRNFIAVAFISVLNICSALVVYRFLRPPMHLGVCIGCIGFFSFLNSYPSGVWMLARKIGLAHVGILYVYAHVSPGMDIVGLPLRLCLSTLLGSGVAVVALILPWPRLGVWEALRLAKSTARSTSELMKAAVSAFSAPDEGSFSSMSLHAKMMRKAALDSLEELKDKQPEIWWELKASCSKRNRFTNMTKGLSGLNQHLTGMEMALQSGYVLQYPEVMRKILEQPLKKVADHCANLLDTATKSLTACSFVSRGGTLNLNAEQRKSLLDEGKLALISFDNAFQEARKVAYYSTPTYEPIVSPEGGTEASASPASPESHILKQSPIEIVAPVHHRFMARLTGNFFLFSLRLYLVEAMHLVDADFSIYSSMYEIAGMRLRDWIPRRLSLIRLTRIRRPRGRKAVRQKPTIEMSKIHEEKVPPGPETPASVGESSNIQASTVRAQVPELPAECNQCKASRLTRSAPNRWNWLGSWVKPKKAQVVKSMKISMIMMLATVFGTVYLPHNVHSCWAPITVSFIIGNLQGGAFRLASLRIQGTAVGSIFGYLVVNELYDHTYVLPVILAVWVSLSDYIRYSKTHGYSGLVSALTAAILMCGDFEGQDIRAFALDRIAMTFIGVSCFVIVETIVLPERAVVLVRKELLRSMKRLRDCVAAIVAVYTSQGCAQCRGTAVQDMQKLEQQLRSGLDAQTQLRNEAVLEPDLWFVPFPGDVYSGLISIQKRMLDLLFFMVCSLQASTQDWSDEHMQRLLKPLSSSLTALDDEVLSTLDALQRLLEKSVSYWNLLPSLGRVSQAFRGMVRCVGDVEKAPPAAPAPAPASPRVRRRRLDRVFEPSRKAARALLALGHRRRSIGGTPMKLKSTMERFEQTFESVLEEVLEEVMIAHNKTPEEVGGMGHVVSNSVMLSISALSFCLHSLLKETVDLEKGVWELLQAENPLSVLDFWDEFGPASQLYNQQPEEEPQPPKKRSSWSGG